MAKKLEVKNLTISFRTNNGAVKAVRDISFDLNEGETLAIAGESGSGKSVTTRAIMGILAGNAMVDGGEIIYDGCDLLKIPEEKFHTLRGHKLAMVFQDPLSALYPIMKIGAQLTEAMILNNKERRADGKTLYEGMLKHLQKNGVPQALIDEFRGKVSAKVQAATSVNTDIDVLTEVSDSLEEIDEALEIKNRKKVIESAKRVQSAARRIGSAVLSGAQVSEVKSLAAAVLEKANKYSPSVETDIAVEMDKLRGIISPCISAQTEDGVADIVTSEFRTAVAEALRRSAGSAAENRANAVKALKAAQKVFTEKELSSGRCKSAAKSASTAVDAAIDSLALEKDNLAYVFSSSINAGIERYFMSLKHNPKEQRRFDKETARHDKLKAKGKFAPSVVPLNLIDSEAVRRNLISITSTLAAHFEELDSASDVDYSARADEMAQWLYSKALDAAFVLGRSVAKHRAIELMKEVGIPEPHRRYTQYPFEFSGGMRQRIVIAIALSANPDILICDEPTTALDVTIQAQILELINRLKQERRLSVIFITHDLGVVANMADRIAIMYAGKIVEYGTADDLFYDPRHPYTWALLSSMPDLETSEKLEAIPGTPPDMILPPVGDAFAARNKYAMEIDFEQQPPMFRVSETHTAATWLLHPDAPKVEPPAIVTARIQRMKQLESAKEGGEA